MQSAWQREPALREHLLVYSVYCSCPLKVASVDLGHFYSICVLAEKVLEKLHRMFPRVPAIVAVFGRVSEPSLWIGSLDALDRLHQVSLHVLACSHISTDGSRTLGGKQLSRRATPLSRRDCKGLGWCRQISRRHFKALWSFAFRHFLSPVKPQRR